jgi:hypothetical protein
VDSPAVAFLTISVACPPDFGGLLPTWEVPVKKFYLYRAASAVAAIVTVVVASGAGNKWG